MIKQENIFSLAIVSVGILILSIIFVVTPEIGYSIDSSNVIPASSYARGTLTISESVTDGELINITDTSGTVYTFEINNTGGITSGYIGINVSSLDAVNASSDIISTINSNIPNVVVAS